MDTPSTATVVALVNDLFFSVRLGNQIKQAGFTPKIVKSAEEFRSAVTAGTVVLGVIDLGAKLDADTLQAIVSSASQIDVPVIAFGPHKDVDALKAAQAAGIDRVMANSVFHGQTIEMIQRYARSESGNARS